MPKYQVHVPYICWVRVETEEDSAEDAKEAVLDNGDTCPLSYVGNGGTGKLIGVEGGMSIDVSDEPYESDDVSIEVEELE